jgi:hypothetical protein
MKKLIVAMMVVCFAVFAAAAASGPETIDLAAKFVNGTPKKPAVQFPHAFHQTKNECTECHMTAEGGALKSIKTGAELKLEGSIKAGAMKNDAHNEFCWECHVAKKVPQGKSCNKCHAK